MKNLYWKRKTNSNGKMIIGTIAGLAAGFTVGMLTAPRPGSETRNLLSSRTSETLEKVGNKMKVGRQKVLEGDVSE